MSHDIKINKNIYNVMPHDIKKELLYSKKDKSFNTKKNKKNKNIFQIKTSYTITQDIIN